MRAVLLPMVLAASLHGQNLQDLSSLDQPAHPHQHITYIAEQQIIPSDKTAVLELRFQVADGFHVNSHTPRSELQIPTNLVLGPASGFKSAAPEYPAGKLYTIGVGETQETLDVYTGDFIVRLPVQATPGPHAVAATLNYQACDRAACYPPRSLKLEIPFTAK